MSSEELKQGLAWAYQRIYSFPSIFKRLTGSFSGGRWRYIGPILALNMGYRKTFKGMEGVVKNPALG
jgi:hypothetical protein